MNDGFDLANPQSRVESYLHNMLGQMNGTGGTTEQYDLSRPQSRVEAYLYNMIGQIATISKKKGFDYKVVTSLPETGEEGTIYFILSQNQDASANDQYDEYVWVNGKPEKIGTDSIKDLNASASIKHITKDEYKSLTSIQSEANMIYVIDDYQTDSDGKNYAATCVGDGKAYIGDLPLNAGITIEQANFINELQQNNLTVAALKEKVAAKVDADDDETLVLYN